MIEEIIPYFFLFGFENDNYLYKLKLRCRLSQLSGVEFGSAFDKRSAISGVTDLCSLIIEDTVFRDTPSRLARSVIEISIRAIPAEDLLYSLKKLFVG